MWYYPTSFDASVSDWGTALYAGGTLLIEPDLTQFTPSELLHWLEEKRVSHADLPPSLLELLPEPESIGSLETVIVGGQATQPATIRRWASRVRLVNVYGPTEATVCTSLNVCESAEKRSLLGQPISDVEYHVVDAELNRVPDGKEGELLITGPCLARGYRNQPEKTREKFVEFQGQRNYRSGDLVRRDSDGSFVFCGRIDRQISLHGQRIEPEEIEASIVEHPNVSGAAVLLRKLFPHSEKARLVAFVETQSEIFEEDMRSHLREILPSERQPQWFEFLPVLPRTDSGKVDLAALAAHTFEEPASVEKTEGLLGIVLELFGEATGESQMGAELRWKDWGADSLSAMHLVALAARRGLEIPLWLLSKNPSPRLVANYLETGDAAAVDDQFPHACPVKRIREDAKEVWRTTLGSVKPVQEVLSSGSDILLTGATGFLGSRVLCELLDQTTSRVICLVRPGGLAAKERLLQHLRNQDLELCVGFDRRVIVQAGDITLPTFGLSVSEYGKMLLDVGTVVHCAANINALASYRELRPTNLLGVANLLEFSRRSRAHLHHASTLSVFVGTDQHAGVIAEDTELSPKLAYGGYTQSKLAAEFLLNEASVIPATTHRLGLLVADRRSQIYPKNDILTSIVSGLMKLGCVPKTDIELQFDVTPVDYTAAAMAATISAQIRGCDQRRLTHLAGRSTMTIGQLLEYLRKHVEIEELDVRQFLERIAASENRGTLGSFEAATLRASSSRWLMQTEGAARELDLFQSTGTIFDCQQTGELMERQGIEWPTLTDKLIDRVLSRICEDSLQEQV